MASCKIEVPVKGELSSFLEKVEAAINKAGGKLEGNTSEGTIELGTPLGKITGTYQLNDDIFNLTITDKPFFISCGQISEVVKKYLSAT